LKIQDEGPGADITHDIFAGIGVTNAQAVEFGFGKPGNWRHMKLERVLNNTHGNTLRLRTQQDWSITFFDNFIDFPPTIVKAQLTEANIVSEFRRAKIPMDVDLVSVDVDSIDIWLFRALLLGGYRPRVFSVEYNPNFGASQMIVMHRVWHEWQNRSSLFGASAAAYNMVAEMFGYRCVHIMDRDIFYEPQRHKLHNAGTDMFFVREEILFEKCLQDTVPTYQELTQRLKVQLPLRMGQTCNDLQASRMVDLPLYLLGLEKEAHARALSELIQVDISNANRFKQKVWTLAKIIQAVTPHRLVWDRRSPGPLCGISVEYGTRVLGAEAYSALVAHHHTKYPDNVLVTTRRSLG